MSTIFNRDIAYIHIPKCGGLSVVDLIRTTVPNTDEPYYRHTPYRSLPKHPYKLVLATVRNPYEQQVSLYNFWRAEYENGKRGDVFNAAHDLSFGQFIRSPYALHGADISQVRAAGGYYRWWITDRDGLEAPNLRLIKLEEIGQLPEVIKPYQVLSGELPHNNACDHAEWESYYQTSDDYETVTDHFGWIFKVGLYKARA